MADIIQKSFNSSRREIKYLNRDFSSFKSSLIEYSKTYFPRTYKDFGDASPGFIGQFVGYRIVEAWLQKNKELPLDKVMKTPAKIIFEQAKYKP